MALTYGFYNSVNGDRRYDAEQLSEMFNGIINDGIFASVGDTFVVSAVGGMNLVVGTGRAWFMGTWSNIDTPYPIALDAADLLFPRIDTVVLEVDRSLSVRANAIKIIKGTPGESPLPPTLVSTSEKKQYPLANVEIAANAASVSQSNVLTLVGQAPTVFVTGILETVDISELMIQWEDQFRTWFNNLGEVLDENTAANLLNLINQNGDYIADLQADVTTLKATKPVGSILYAYKNIGGAL